MRILLAEDDFVTRKFMTNFLSKYGECDVTVDGMEAVDAFMMAMEEDNPYDLVCLDIMMPGLNDVDTLRSIRKQENGLCKDVPVIVLMANAVAGARQLYEEYVFDGYPEKLIQGSMLEKEVLKCYECLQCRNRNNRHGIL